MKSSMSRRGCLRVWLFTPWTDQGMQEHAAGHVLVNHQEGTFTAGLAHLC